MVQNPKYKSAERIIHQLCDIVAKNGNLLLNVGPYADGSFHPDAVRILEEIGDWLALNGEAVYESRPFAVAAEGPTTVEDADYDVGKIEEQLDKGGAVDVHSDTLTAQDFRFTTGTAGCTPLPLGGQRTELSISGACARGFLIWNG